MCPQLLECWITLVTLPHRPQLDAAHGAVALFAMVILHDQVWVNKKCDDFMQYIISHMYMHIHSVRFMVIFCVRFVPVKMFYPSEYVR